MAGRAYAALAVGALVAHLLFILWVIFGALLVRGRPRLRRLHIVSLGYGIVSELAPWACPLTAAETWLESRAGLAPYRGPFLLHYLDKLVYPNLSPTLLTWGGVAVCALNLLLYARRFRKRRGARP